MTTIILSERTKTNGGRFQVVGNYEGKDDRFTFAVENFDTRDEAEAYARRCVEAFKADRFERVTG